MHPTEVVADLVRKRFFPIGNLHEEEFKAKFIGGSSIVKLTALEYAHRILAQKRGEPEMHDPLVSKFYSFEGNTLAGEAFADADAQEVRATMPLVGPWILAIHPDAAFVVEGSIVVGENKRWDKAPPEKMEPAFRQGALGLAVMHDEAMACFTRMSCRNAGMCRQDGLHLFERAAWHKGERFVWPMDRVASGVTVAIAMRPEWVNGSIDPDSGPILAPRPMTTEELDAVLAFYRAKALAIIAAVNADDVGPALAWDEAHPLEFTRPLHSIDEPIDITARCAEWRKWSALRDEADANRYRVGQEVVAAMRMAGKKKGLVGEDGDGFEVEVRLDQTKATVSVEEVLGLADKVRAEQPSLADALTGLVKRSKASSYVQAIRPVSKED